MKKVTCLITLLLATFALCACQHTVQGFGKDMQNTGQEIQKSAQ